MRQITNPVFQEGIQVYFTEGRGFMVYFFYLIILALVQFLTLVLPTGDPRFWMGPAYLFKLSSVAALLLLVYFSLRITNQEFLTSRFQLTKHWFSQGKMSLPRVAMGQISLLCLHLLVFLLLSSPLLGWAGAIEHAPVGAMLSTLLLLFFYSLTYSMWGLFALAMWDHREDSRRVFIRCLLVCLLLVSGLLYLPLNPVAFLLHHLEGVELSPLKLWEWKWDAPTVHFAFHLSLLVLGILCYGVALKRLKEGYS